jgi:23S rRNA (cytosine1962-C5)-methyltransferase
MTGTMVGGRARLDGRGRRWVEGGHPWVWADQLREVEAEPGALVAVEAPDGRRLGWALYSSASKIALRLCSRSEREPDAGFWRRRVERAVAARGRMGLLDPAGAERLLAGDSDLVPGLVADRYAGVLVLQSGAQGSDRLVEELARELERALPFALEAVLERSDASVRRLEALEPRVRALRGAPPERVLVREDELAYEVDLVQGHKTGHYLDQRENRRRAARLAGGGRVLDLFCYDGLFGIRAALAGAREVLCVDQSEAAGERVRANAERNGVAGRVRFVRADAMRQAGRGEELGDEPFDLVVVDPPAFARNRRELEGAERGYVELNRRALARVAAPGRLVTASCSHAVRPERFVELLAEAARRARRDVWLEELAGAAPDHPALLALPESSYLKCAFLRVERPCEDGEPEGAR